MDMRDCEVLFPKQCMGLLATTPVKKKQAVSLNSNKAL